MTKRTVTFGIFSLTTAAIFFAASAMAQVHGTPAGATSVGGGRTFANPPGIPAGATSLGPRGYNGGVRFQMPIVPQQHRDFNHRDFDRSHRVFIPTAVPLYSYGVYPYLYSSYSSSEMSTADYRTEAPEVTRALQPQIVVAPVQQPPQVIVIDNRGVRDATDEEREEAIAARKTARKPKQEEPKPEAKAQPEDEGPMT